MAENVSERILGVCARAPDAARSAAIAVLIAAGVGVIGFFTAGIYALLIAVLLGGALVLATHSPQPIEIGSDGLAFVSRRGSFLSFGRVAAIEEANAALVLNLCDGRRLRLTSADRGGLDAATIDRIRALVLSHWHWQEARAPITLPPRAGATLAQWLEAIRASEAASDRERLLTCVEDPALSARLRATCALLLRNRLTLEERARLERAARTTVAAKLRHALELIASPIPNETQLLAEIEALPTGDREPRVRWLRSQEPVLEIGQSSRMSSRTGAAA